MTKLLYGKQVDVAKVAAAEGPTFALPVRCCLAVGQGRLAAGGKLPCRRHELEALSLVSSDGCLMV